MYVVSKSEERVRGRKVNAQTNKLWGIRPQRVIRISLFYVCKKKTTLKSDIGMKMENVSEGKGMEETGNLFIMLKTDSEE